MNGRLKLRVGAFAVCRVPECGHVHLRRNAMLIYVAQGAGSIATLHGQQNGLHSIQEKAGKEWEVCQPLKEQRMSQACIRTLNHLSFDEVNLNRFKVDSAACLCSLRFVHC